MLASTQRLLDIEKSRSGCSGLFQIQLDVDDYSWQYQGDFDPSQAGHEGDRPIASLPLKARLLNFLEERPGVPFEVEELVGEFGSNRETVRKTLDRLWRSGLVQTEERTKSNNNGKGGQTKYKVYLVADLSQRLEPIQNQGLVAGTTGEVSLGQGSCPNDNLPIVPATKLAPIQDSVSLGQTNSGIDPTSKTDSQPNILPSLPAPQSKQPRRVPDPNAIPEVSDFVLTPDGQGIIRMSYPNGQFGVELEGGRSFSAWSAAEITVLRFST